MRWLIGHGESSFWYDCWLCSCPLVIYNLTMAFRVLISFYWRGTICDKGKLQDVLSFSIVE